MEERTKGALYGILAYGLWGVFPLYFKAVAAVPAMEILAHRILWSFLALAALVVASRRTGEILAALRNRKAAAMLCGSTLLIAVNWLLFVIAVTTDRVLESSLGYFMNPLVNILLGHLFLGERLRRAQRVSLLLAAAGAALLVARHGSVPWISAALAVTFAFYALLRKLAPVDSLSGLTFETALLAPAAFALIAWGVVSGRGAFLAGSGRYDLILPLAGFITAVPLLAFGAAARRVRLSTLGFLQYISPTGHFLLAVFVFGEPFGKGELAAFLLIWAGLAVYSVDAIREVRSAGPPYNESVGREQASVLMSQPGDPSQRKSEKEGGG